MSTSFVDADGTTRFRGTIVGGAAQPAGTLSLAELLIEEQATAKTWSASFPVARYSVVFDVLLIQLAPWASDSAVLDVGDTQGGAGSYWDAYDLVNMGITWDPVAAINGSAAQMYNSLSDEGGDSMNGYRFASRYVSNAWPPGVTYYDADDTITIACASTIAVPPVVPTGRTLIRIRYTTPIQPTLIPAT